VAKILIIDDSSTIRDDLRRTLEGAQHIVLDASDGERGLELICNTPELDLVITDLHMPALNGIEMLKRANEKSKLTGLKIFVHTSDASLTMRTAGKDVGVSGWILKPYNPESLLGAIKAILS
jgi:two-component system chemotaxis response regulator CheY